MLPDRAIKRLYALPDISKEGKRINGLFRLIEVPELWLQAYASIYANKGAMTQGVGSVTMDRFSIERATNLIELLKDGRYRPNPVRRTYVPKPGGKKRPLGMPSGDDKVVQEMVRMLLEQIYEPVFSNWSHGFRPNRSCHTALKQVERWDGVTWLVEVDIKGFFDNIDHEVMVQLLEKKIDDKRFIDLIRAFLKAGYMEDWRYHGTYSGTPQGGILSPILANVYLHELDTYMESMATGFNKGKRRGNHPEYQKYNRTIHAHREAIRERRERGEAMDSPAMVELKQQIRELDKARKAIPAKNPMAADFRRLHYCRYADDTLVGVIGSKHDADNVMSSMRVFIENALHLNIAEEKSRISHAAKGTFFLSYEVIMRTTDKLKRIKSPKGRYTLKRTVVDRMTLRIPEEKLRKFCHNKGYGDYNTLKTQHRPILRERSDIEIVLTYNAELRGLANYYCLAYSAKSRLSRLYYIWKGGLLKTLAAKHKTTVRKVMKSHKIGKDLAWRYEAKGKTRTQRAFSIRQWSPSWTANRDIDIQPYTYAFTAGRTEIVQRLNARKCEYCGTTEGYFDVHHIRKLADLKDGKALWQKVMSAMRRKTLVLCIECHDRLHSGQLPDWRWRSRIEAESRMP